MTSEQPNAVPVSYLALITMMKGGTVDHMTLFYRDGNEIADKIFVRFIGEDQSFRAELTKDRIQQILALSSLLLTTDITRILSERTAGIGVRVDAHGYETIGQAN